LVRGDTVDQDVRCLIMDSRANIQAFFATQVEAVVYFMMVILQMRAVGILAGARRSLVLPAGGRIARCRIIRIPLPTQ